MSGLFLPDAAGRQTLVRELVRHWRAGRSQQEMSQALGYRSNIVSPWETGRKVPSAATGLRMARMAGRPVQRLAGLMPSDWRERVEVDTPLGVALLIGDHVGTRTVSEVARAADLSRHALTRYLNAAAEPNLTSLLAVLCASGRLQDALPILADPLQLPSTRDAWATHRSAQQCWLDQPLAGLVQLALYLDDYQALPAHREGWLAERLQISLDQERAALEALSAAGQIRLEDGRYHCVPDSVMAEVPAEIAPDVRARHEQLASARLFTGTPRGRHIGYALLSSAELRKVEHIFREAVERFHTLASTTQGTEHLVFVAVAVNELAVSSRLPSQRTNGTLSPTAPGGDGAAEN